MKTCVADGIVEASRTDFERTFSLMTSVNSGRGCPLRPSAKRVGMVAQMQINADKE